MWIKLYMTIGLYKSSMSHSEIVFILECVAMLSWRRSFKMSLTKTVGQSYFKMNLKKDHLAFSKMNLLRRKRDLLWKKVQETVMDLMDSTCYKMNPTNVGFHNIRSLGLRMMKLKIAPYQIPVLLRTWGRMRRTMICIRSCSWISLPSTSSSHRNWIEWQHQRVPLSLGRRRGATTTKIAQDLLNPGRMPSRLLEDVLPRGIVQRLGCKG